MRRTRPRAAHPRALRPVRAELAAWLLERPPNPNDEHDLLFRRPDGKPWADHDYRNWRKRRFSTAVARADSKIARPYDLRHRSNPPAPRPQSAAPPELPL